MKIDNKKDSVSEDLKIALKLLVSNIVKVARKKGMIDEDITKIIRKNVTIIAEAVVAENKKDNLMETLKTGKYKGMFKSAEQN